MKLLRLNKKCENDNCNKTVEYFIKLNGEHSRKYCSKHCSNQMQHKLYEMRNWANDKESLQKAINNKEKYEKTRIAISATVKKLWEQGVYDKRNNNLCNTGSKRYKWFDYESPYAGKIKLHGTYELRWARILDKMCDLKQYYTWRHEYQKIGYGKKKNGRLREYNPDFTAWRYSDAGLEYHETKGWLNNKEIKKMDSIKNQQIYGTDLKNKDLYDIRIINRETLKTYEKELAIQ